MFPTCWLFPDFSSASVEMSSTQFLQWCLRCSLTFPRPMFHFNSTSHGQIKCHQTDKSAAVTIYVTVWNSWHLFSPHTVVFKSCERHFLCLSASFVSALLLLLLITRACSSTSLPCKYAPYHVSIHTLHPITKGEEAETVVQPCSKNVLKKESTDEYIHRQNSDTHKEETVGPHQIPHLYQKMARNTTVHVMVTIETAEASPGRSLQLTLFLFFSIPTIFACVIRCKPFDPVPIRIYHLVFFCL